MTKGRGNMSSSRKQRRLKKILKQTKKTPTTTKKMANLWTIYLSTRPHKLPLIKHTVHVLTHPHAHNNQVDAQRQANPNVCSLWNLHGNLSLGKSEDLLGSIQISRGSLCSPLEPMLLLALLEPFTIVCTAECILHIPGVSITMRSSSWI